MEDLVRLDIFIEQRQKKILSSIKVHAGIPISEQVRRAIDKYIEEFKNDYKRNLGQIKSNGKETGRDDLLSLP